MGTVPKITFVKSTLRRAMASLYYATNHFLTRLQGKVIVLTYHRVISERELKQSFIQPGMYVRNDVFEKQMEFLREHFHILTFHELLRMWEEREWDETKRYCVITFDDGWLDNYVYAYPVLKKHSIPATVFLPTSFVGTQKWFWPDRIGVLLRTYLKEGVAEKKRGSISSLWTQYPWMTGFEKRPNEEKIDLAIERWKTLPEDEVYHFIENTKKILEVDLPDDRLVVNWEEVREMSGNGISFGSHSANHRILTRIKVAGAKEEIKNSLGMLTGKNTNFVPVFCYPDGEYNNEIQELVKRGGYRAAVTTRFGFESKLPENLFGIKRIGIHNDISERLSLFSWHIAGLNEVLRRGKGADLGD